MGFAPPAMHPPRSTLRLCLLLAVVAVQLALVVSPAFNLATSVDLLLHEHGQMRRDLHYAPALATLQFFMLYVAAATLLLPGAALLSLSAGAVFGMVPGVLLASTASTLGAWVAFLVTRGLLKDLFDRVAPAAARGAVAALERRGTLWLVAARLTPLVPFSLVNVGFGLTAMSSRRFLLLSWLSMLPGTIAYVGLGTTLSRLDAGQWLVTPAQVLGLPLLTGLTAVGLALAAFAVRSNRVAAAPAAAVD